MPASIFNSGAVKILKSILRFKDSNVEIITNVSTDPTVVAYDAPQGSMYIRQGTGRTYKKLDNGLSTNWQLQTEAGDLTAYQLLSEKGSANGYAPLDGAGRLPVANLPTGATVYAGTWNASTNTPALANGTGISGTRYVCTVAGTANFGAGPIVFAINDEVLYNGSIWQRIPNSSDVVSVNGFQGAVTLGTADVVSSNSITNAMLQANIDATKISSGTVTNTEFDTLDGVTSGIQGQLDGKANTALSNLATTSVNVDVLPSADLTRVLGSPTRRWAGAEIFQILNAGVLSVRVGVRQLVNAAGTNVLDWSGTDLNVLTRKITNLANGTAATDAVNKGQLDAVTVANDYNERTNTATTSIPSGGGDVLFNTAVESAVITYNAGTGEFSNFSTGRYLINCTLTFSANSVGRRGLFVNLNGTNYRLGNIGYVANGGSGVAVNGTASIRLTSTDLIKIVGFQDSGSTLTLNGDPTGNFVSIDKIGN